ncbi:MAG: MATE family efflux transporter [Rhizobiales bacterium]|nr:MATE family efflux transporter [Hyphomicrobiales bacterium]
MTTPASSEPFEINHARVLAIAVPMTLANVTTPLLGLIAMAAIGQLGEAHLLGAVAIASVVFDCLFWLFGFLRMGTVALTAQALGRRDSIEQRAVLARALILAALIGGALVALQWPLGSIAFKVMGASDAVTQAAQTYFFVRIWSAPFALGHYAVLGWLVGQARTTLALGLQIAINVTSIAAVSLLVLRLDFGVAGAAAAAVIAEAAGLALGIGIAARINRDLTRIPREQVFDRAKLTRMLAVNRDIMIRTAALIAAFLFFSAQSARAGDTVLAANAVLNNLVLVSAYFLDGFATASEQLCGRSVGGRDGIGFRRAVRLSLGWGYAVAFAISFAILIAGDQFIAMMTTSPEVRVVAREFALFAALAPFAGVAAYTFDGIFIGATWTRDMRNLMVAALVLYLVSWFALREFGNAGLWAALLIFLVARGALQAARYPALLRGTFAETTRSVSA